MLSPKPLRAAGVLLALALLTTANSASAIVLTAPPPPASIVSTSQVCAATVTVNGQQFVQPVCATATFKVDWSCVLDGPTHTLCTMVGTFTGAGHSPLKLPGTYTWPPLGTQPGFNGGFTKCDGNEQGSGQICLSGDGIFTGGGSWPGLTGPSGASDSQSITQSIRMPLNFPIIDPHCYLLSVFGGLVVQARVINNGITIGTATAQAGTGMTQSFCN